MPKKLVLETVGGSFQLSRFRATWKTQKHMPAVCAPCLSAFGCLLKHMQVEGGEEPRKKEKNKGQHKQRQSWNYLRKREKRPTISSWQEFEIFCKARQTQNWRTGRCKCCSEKRNFGILGLQVSRKAVHFAHHVACFEHVFCGLPSTREGWVASNHRRARVVGSEWPVSFSLWSFYFWLWNRTYTNNYTCEFTKKKLHESDLMEPLTGTGAPVEKSTPCAKKLSGQKRQRSKKKDREGNYRGDTKETEKTQAKTRRDRDDTEETQDTKTQRRDRRQREDTEETYRSDSYFEFTMIQAENRKNPFFHFQHLMLLPCFWLHLLLGPFGRCEQQIGVRSGRSAERSDKTKFLSSATQDRSFRGEVFRLSNKLELDQFFFESEPN